ncbi:hypothetical protein GOP47_0019979 [Adiantum capillus-veneris]|uniref:Uncharacterized protein n=1 Tax=Adiantum capillus-veneris TaxID=13818 RepID=A0A9D4UC32_ADICA|nr:hypothetical protein GOP47_0019979 [Adiantum capillus-veneris]
MFFVFFKPKNHTWDRGHGSIKLSRLNAMSKWSTIRCVFYGAGAGDNNNWKRLASCNDWQGCENGHRILL